MPMFTHCDNTLADTRPNGLVSLLRAWLILGAIALVVFPEARRYSTEFGYVAYWLVAAPSLLLATLNAPRWHARLRAATTTARLAGQPAWVTSGRRRARNRRSSRSLAQRRYA